MKMLPPRVVMDNPFPTTLPLGDGTHLILDMITLVDHDETYVMTGWYLYDEGRCELATTTLSAFVSTSGWEIERAYSTCDETTPPGKKVLCFNLKYAGHVRYLE